MRPTNTLRIVAGEWRGRVLRFPDLPGLRPTPDRVRETLFNWLGQDLTGRRCLDVFAGSGALGIEARSRNAKEVVFLEASRRAALAIEQTLSVLKADRCRVLCCDALEFIRSGRSEVTGGLFDVVFLDPPFGSGLLEKALECVPDILAPGGVVYVESDARGAGGARWREIKQGRAGTVRFGILAVATESGEGRS